MEALQGIKHIPAGEYHAGPGTSKSDLQHLAKSPAHYKEHKTNVSREPTEAMQFGTLLHTLLLEPDEIENIVARGPDCERRAKADKARWEQFWRSSDGKVRLTHDGRIIAKDGSGTIKASTKLTIDLADTLCFVLRSKLASREALESGGMVERSLYHTDPETGILVRCRPDILHNGPTISDVKTCEDASYEGFSKQIANFDYHVQAAMYLDIANALGMDKQTFGFIAVEKEPPYASACYFLGIESPAIELGRRIYRQRLRLLAECIEKDNWPDYPDQWQEIDLPMWAYRKES